MKTFILSLNAVEIHLIKNYFGWKNKAFFHLYGSESKVLSPQESDIEEWQNLVGLAKYEESVNGAKNFINDVINSKNNYDVFIEFPFSFLFEYVYENFSNERYIYIDIDKNSWIAKMINMANVFSHQGNPYQFETFFCNYYNSTGKLKIQDLTEEELGQIFDLHKEKINNFFIDKENFIFLNSSDEDLITKINNFVS